MTSLDVRLWNARNASEAVGHHREHNRTGSAEATGEKGGGKFHDERNEQRAVSFMWQSQKESMLGQLRERKQPAVAALTGSFIRPRLSFITRQIQLIGLLSFLTLPSGESVSFLAARAQYSTNESDLSAVLNSPLQTSVKQTLAEVAL